MTASGVIRQPRCPKLTRACTHKAVASAQTRSSASSPKADKGTPLVARPLRGPDADMQSVCPNIFYSTDADVFQAPGLDSYNIAF